jgi:hypothetical protein
VPEARFLHRRAAGEKMVAPYNFFLPENEERVKKEVLARGPAETRKSANPRATCGGVNVREII